MLEHGTKDAQLGLRWAHAALSRTLAQENTKNQNSSCRAAANLKPLGVHTASGRSGPGRCAAGSRLDARCLLAVMYRSRLRRSAVRRRFSQAVLRDVHIVFQGGHVNGSGGIGYIELRALV